MNFVHTHTRARARACVCVTLLYKLLIYILKKQYANLTPSHLNRELTLNQCEVDTRFAGYAQSSVTRKRI